MIQITRREFLSAAGASASVAILPNGVLAGPAADVFMAYHSEMVKGSTPNGVWVQAGLDACIKALASQTDLGKAWERLFKGITNKSKVSVKLNCLKKGVSVNFATIQAVVTGLKAMFNGACSESRTTYAGAQKSFHGSAPHRPYVDLFGYMRGRKKTRLIGPTSSYQVVISGILLFSFKKRARIRFFRNNI